MSVIRTSSLRDVKTKRTPAIRPSSSEKCGLISVLQCFTSRCPRAASFARFSRGSKSSPLKTTATSPSSSVTGCRPSAQGNSIKIVVILRRSDARLANAAGIVQPKNPVNSRRSSRLFTGTFAIRLSTGSFTAHRPTLALADVPFRMTALF